MRIAVFIKRTTFHKGHGGLETQNKNLCEGLAKLGHDLVVFSPKRELTKDVVDDNGLKYIFVPCSLRYLFSDINPNSWEHKSVGAFSELHANKPFDLVLGQSSAALGYIQRKHEFGIKVISISHGTALGEINTFFNNISSPKDVIYALRNIQYFFRQYFGRQREFVLKSDRIIAVSTAVRNQLLEETFVPEDRVVVIHNGIEPAVSSDISSRFSPSRKGTLALLYVGQVSKDKGCDTFISLIKSLSAYDVTLHVVGVGTYYESLKRQIKDNHLEQKIILHGWKDYGEVRKIFSDTSIDAFLFPTKRMEGFPMVLVEAMFGGLPVIAFDMGGVGDAVDQKTGFLLKRGDLSALCDAVTTLCEDVTLRERMSTAALAKAHAQFTLTHMLMQYITLMESLK